MIPIVDSLLNKFTMYKVVLFGLLVLFGVAFIYSFQFFKPNEIVLSFFILSVTCIGINVFISKILKVALNTESAFITALILFFIMDPRADLDEIWIYVLAGVVAMASKYIIAINHKHIFNPAAFSLFILGLFGLPVSFWWIGSNYAFPFVLIIGFLVLKKMRKLSMFITFAFFTLSSIMVFALLNDKDLYFTLYSSVVSHPLLFLGAFMLTEPLTTPPRKNMQLIYASIVGLLTGLPLSIGPVSTTPELSLLIGNLFSYSVSFKKRLELNFQGIKILSPDIYEFSFTKPENFSFMPGQYIEWTLGGFRSDMRGVRRFFTIASSPTEENIKIGIRASGNISAFKKRLLNLKKGDKISAGNLAGDFTLSDKNRKYVFIAGGVGITPFRSIVKNAVDKHEKINAVLIYSCSREEDFIYRDLFEYAKIIGLKTIYVCSHPTEKWKGVKGRVDSRLIQNEVTDYKERVYYLSGSNAIVNSTKRSLIKMGVFPTKIKTDYFSGY